MVRPGARRRFSSTFFCVDGVGVFLTPPNAALAVADRCRLPPGRPGGGSGGPYRKFDAFGLLRARARMHKLQGCGDLGVGVASRTRNGGMVLGAGEFGAGGVFGKILIFFVLWGDVKQEQGTFEVFFAF